MSDITVGTDWFAGENKAVVDEVVAGQVGFTLHFTDGTAHKRTTSTTVFLNTYKQDMVNNPPHYKDASGIECIEVTKYMSFLGGNCFKYLYRAGSKGDAIEDLKKAAWYAERAHEQKEVVSHQLLEDIWLISSHRSRNISLAIDFIAEDMWLDAKQFIEAEIARLESE